jgi:predicted nucleic acid-binding protein
MKSTLVDANVLLDLFDDDSEWQDWSAAALTQQARRGDLIINPIILAEVAAGFSSVEELDEVLPAGFLEREALPWEAACLAARAFVIYRHAGGQRRSPLPDFYIGAHAAVAGYTLLTRDDRRYRHYFPKLRIVAP